MTYEDIQKKYNFFISEDDASKMYETMWVVDLVFKKFDIDYSVSGGTLIGAIRHSGLIPWDDDLDIMVLEPGFRRMYESDVIGEFNNHGYNLIIERNKKFVTHIYKESDPSLIVNEPIHIKTGRPLFHKHKLKYNQGKPFVKSAMCDFFPHREIKKNVFQPYWGGYRGRDKISSDEIFPTQRKQFGTFEVSVVNRYEDYMKRYFGGDVLINAKLTRSHTGTKTPKNKKIVARENFIDLQVPCNFKPKTKKTIITYGTFDTFHYGHIELLRRAKELGDYLVVAVSSDQFNLNKSKQCIFPAEKRKEWVGSIGYVDEVIDETCWEQKSTDIEKYSIDIFVMGDDWKGKFDELACKVVYLPRTDSVSTTGIKQILSNDKS